MHHLHFPAANLSICAKEISSNGVEYTLLEGNQLSTPTLTISFQAAKLISLGKSLLLLQIFLSLIIHQLVDLVFGFFSKAIRMQFVFGFFPKSIRMQFIFSFFFGPVMLRMQICFHCYGIWLYQILKSVSLIEKILYRSDFIYKEKKLRTQFGCRLLKRLLYRVIIH